MECSQYVSTTENKKVVLIRDHAGIKPLFRYQSRDGKTLSYSSEIKSFIEYSE